MEKLQVESSIVHRPRPVPVFVHETSFSQRKKTPFKAPKAPAKTCPPVSRILRRINDPNASGGPQLVSFKSERKCDALMSPHFNSDSNKSYFEQCFHVGKKLGEGSFGIVYSARNREDGHMYAVKKSRQQFRGERDRKLKLEEVEKHEHLPHHPNCVQFHKAWEERNKLYIQTELCQMSLAEYADLHGGVPEQRVWHMLVDLVKGLKHLHDNRLCHFDIKPANIFLSEDNFTCKLGDFGLCSSLDQDFLDAMEGDAKYLAPELMNHQFGKPADIFSLGISLLELACDVELPSGGQNWHLLRTGQIPPYLMKDLSPGLVNILCRMMHPDPKLRPTVDEILGDRCVVLAGYQQSCYKACGRLFSVCKHVLGRLIAVLFFFLSVFPVKRKKSVADGECRGADEGGGTVLHNESFSDDEDELVQYSLAHSPEDGGDPNAKFNRSWIKNSPVRYPSPVYTGPPIPIDFGDSSFDSSPDRIQDTRYSPYKSSPCRFTSNSSAGELSLNKSRCIQVSVEPKSLMKAFTDTLN